MAGRSRLNIFFCQVLFIILITDIAFIISVLPYPQNKIDSLVAKDQYEATVKPSNLTNFDAFRLGNTSTICWKRWERIGSDFCLVDESK